MAHVKDILKEGTVIVGLGLIGSSFARAIKDLSSFYYVSGLVRRESILNQAKQDAVIDDGALLNIEEDKVRSELGKAGLVILSMYPEGILEFLDQYKDSFRKGAVVIDICGLKGDLVEEAQRRMPEGVEYVATHPMAGKEKSGYENGDGEMFLGASFIMTPTEHNTKEALDELRYMAARMGFGKIREVSPYEHDELIAYTSHIPHVVAASIVNSWEGTEDVVSFGGGSLRDTTRVAEINAALWSELFLHNQGPLLKQLDRFIDTVVSFREALEKMDEKALTDFLNASAERKIAWNRKVARFDDGTGDDTSR